MKVFQVPYNWIKSWKTPLWLQRLLNFLLHKVIVPTVKQLGEAAMTDLQKLIKDASTKDWSNKKKFEYVFNNFKNEWGNPNNLKDHTINLLIELGVAKLKKEGIIE